MDHFSDVATDDLFTACVKSPLKLDLFFVVLSAKAWAVSTGKALSVLGQNKNTTRPKQT